MSETQLAVQLYTLRDHTKTVEQLDATCGKIAAQGWRAVQVSAVGVSDPAEIRRILDKHGLQCCATHEKVLENPREVIARQQTLGCTYTAPGGYFPSEADFTEANWRQYADLMNQVIDLYAEAGIRLGYHNHSHEWATVTADLDAPRAIDLLVNLLDKRVCFEWDTYWIAHAGGDPAQWIRDFAGRVPAIHLKDMGIARNREPFMMEVGQGNLNWPAILDAARESGVEWYIVEQDVCYRDPFDSLATSLANLRRMGLK